MQQHPIELLSPARDLACGVAAVNHGADAVYIGPPRFGARAAAGNSLQDIERLIAHAHAFSARVYIALNTLFTDRELEEAVRLAHQLYEIGADALIIQDMGLLECDLPPIPLHASTQTNNRTAEKVRFLERVGFQQVVLARELSLEQIREIRSATTVPLECFIHGALCVSYSGQCYISELVSGRSANRGECAQFCRHRYTLRDGAGKILEKDRYLLSLKDLDLSTHLRRLLAAGVSSFKIEGRLKDSNYVKNVTAFYRQLLDKLLEEGDTFHRSSSGHCVYGFVPDTSKSFNRGKTDYFLTTPRNTPGSLDTPKSLGERIGSVVSTQKGGFTLHTDKALHNGDGLCYFDGRGLLVGLNANRVSGNTVYHRERFSPPVGTTIFRNLDVEFGKQLQKSEQCRFLMVSLQVEEVGEGLRCTVEDGDNIVSGTTLAVEKERAKKPGMIGGLIERQMVKSGGTVFRVERVRVNVGDQLFIPAAAVNELRRLAFANHLAERRKRYERQQSTVVPNTVAWLSKTATYLDNITNAKAKAFYRRHGVTRFELAPEGLRGEESPALMTTKYCIKAQLGICPKMRGKSARIPEPLTLEDNTGVYELEFACDRCEMIVRLQKTTRG